jgi:hypothetical protein
VSYWSQVEFEDEIVSRTKQANKPLRRYARKAKKAKEAAEIKVAAAEIKVAAAEKTAAADKAEIARLRDLVKNTEGIQAGSKV